MPTPAGDPAGAAGSWTMSLHSPESTSATAFVRSVRTGATRSTVMTREGSSWAADLAVDDGDLYWFVVDGVGPLVDPGARDVAMTPEGPRGVVRRTWPTGSRGAPRARSPVVYEAHVRGLAHTFDGIRQRLPYLSDLGIDVIELMPVHPFDTTRNYWGYMPIVWGAVHGPYAADADAPAELAALVAAAHLHGIHVWLDVVYNHTGEGDATQPTWTLRGLDDRHAYLRNADGTYNDDTGCGNVIDPSNDEIRRLVLESLQRFADLGIDGFRFDLASILTRDGGRLVRMIGDWADAAGVTLVAEAWDLAQYQVGASFPDGRWMQWNDRFRDDIRGFLRAEPGMVPAVMQRIAGSPDLFGGDTWRSVNFVTAHDGLTLHDLMSVTSDRHRSWDAGPERRVQQMKNAFALLLLSTGAPMFVMGDEFARTQQGHDNPYDLDTDLNWVDWGRLPKWAELHSWVRSLISLRHAHVHERPPRFHGTAGEPDTTAESRSFAWCFDGALYVMANMWWNGIDFEVQEPGRWTVALSTAPEVELAGHVEAIRVPARSIVVLTRESAGPDGARG